MSEVFFSQGSESQSLLLKYIKLVIISLYSQWQSYSQVFIVCLKLHIDIILGFYFLKRNRLIIDSEAGSLTDRLTGFDLLYLSAANGVLPRKTKEHF